jgi:formate dehydrogenase maturation protein FdhE
MNNPILSLDLPANYVAPKSCIDCRSWADCMFDRNTDPKVTAFTSDPANHGDADMRRCPGFAKA